MRQPAALESAVVGVWMHRPRRNAKESTMQTTYTVSGMTCGHCVNSVQAEVGQLPGVTEVHVDLANGAVTITSDAPLDETAVRAAVDEAGYTLVS
jgi:copper chaperone